MSFKNKKKHKLKKFNLFEKRDKLEEAAFLIEGERFHEAIDFLEEAIEKYPGETQFWEFLAFAASESGEVGTMQKAFGKLTEIKPKDAEVWLGLASSYALEGRVALAYQVYQEIIVRFPEDENIEDVHNAFDSAEEELQRIFLDFGFEFNDQNLEIAYKHERAQILMNQHKFDEAVELARELLKEKPDFVPALNNLSLILYMKGEVGEACAVAEKVLAVKPDNFHALANLVRFCVFLGRLGEAEKHAALLRKTESGNLDSSIKKIEAFSFLGDDAAVVEEFAKSKKLKNELMIPQSYAKHLAAFAFYRLGDEKKGEKLWEEIIEEDIEFDYSEANLEQMDLPAHERDVFGLPLAYWIPPAYLDKLFKATAKIKDGKNFDKNLQKTLGNFFEENPNILKLIPILLDRSDLNAKEFAVKLLDWAETPEALKLLEDFAFSQTGSDQIRHAAMMTLSRLNLVSNRVKMWQGGELKEMILMNFEITEEPTDIYPMKAKAQDFLRRGLEARQIGNLELAEQYFQKARDANGDHPSLLYNLLAIKQTKGTVEEANEELKRIVEKFPEYSFAAISLATQYARQGRPEEAKKLTEKFYEKKKWHFSEMKVWFYFNLELAITEKQFDSARNSIKMLEEFDENFDKNYWEERITNLELIEKLAPLLEKAGKKRQRKTKSAKI